MPSLELTNKQKEMVVKTEEYYQAIRTNIQLRKPEAHVIGVNSIEANHTGEVAFNLALAYANVGHRTVFIDANIKKPGQVDGLAIATDTKGLTDYLKGEVAMEDLLLPVEASNLQVILSGQTTVNGSSLSSNQAFKDLVKYLDQEYDYVFINTAPLSLGADSVLVAQECDATILVAEAGKTKRQSIQKATEQLEQTGTPFLGLVLNQFNPFYS